MKENSEHYLLSRQGISLLFSTGLLWLVECWDFIPCSVISSFTDWGNLWWQYGAKVVASKLNTALPSQAGCDQLKWFWRGRQREAEQQHVVVTGWMIPKQSGLCLHTQMIMLAQPCCCLCTQAGAKSSAGLCDSHAGCLQQCSQLGRQQQTHTISLEGGCLWSGLEYCSTGYVSVTINSQGLPRYARWQCFLMGR